MTGTLARKDSNVGFRRDAVIGPIAHGGRLSAGSGHLANAYGEEGHLRFQINIVNHD